MRIVPRDHESSTSTARRVTRLVGESLREVAILIAVFVPLEVFMQGRPLTVQAIAGIIAVVVFLLILGIFLEVQ